MLSWFPTRSEWVADQNVDELRSRPAELKNMLEIAVCMEKNSKFFFQQMAQTHAFQMRYENLPNSEKQPNDRLTGWGTSCFQITPVLMFSWLFLLELHRHWPESRVHLHFGLPLSPLVGYQATIPQCVEECFRFDVAPINWQLIKKPGFYGTHNCLRFFHHVSPFSPFQLASPQVRILDPDLVTYYRRSNRVNKAE